MARNTKKQRIEDLRQGREHVHCARCNAETLHEVSDFRHAMSLETARFLIPCRKAWCTKCGKVNYTGFLLGSWDGGFLSQDEQSTCAHCGNLLQSGFTGRDGTHYAVCMKCLATTFIPKKKK